MFAFSKSTYSQLPARFFERVTPAQISHPKLIKWNDTLASELGWSRTSITDESLAQFFSGQELLENSEPLAQAYAGHQFGHFVPQLGDGRTNLIGEIIASSGQRFDVQLKGSGATAFSRSGDGKAALGPALREYIVSEAMHYLKVPTTRSLAIVGTGENVQREQILPGAILTRIAASHIRIGHFEFFASRNDFEGLKLLADFAIQRHDPELTNLSDKYILFYKSIVERQAKLIAHWMDIGFIHGVMNTDNMLVSGETIDYGPCAFIDHFNYNQVFSSIDKRGRYAYIQQAPIAHWNLSNLANCLLQIPNANVENNLKYFERLLSSFQELFELEWTRRICEKLGIFQEQLMGFEIVKLWLDYLQKESLDYTNSFRQLATFLLNENDLGELKPTAEFENFKNIWLGLLTKQGLSPMLTSKKMNQLNPAYIPRNHQIEKAINEAHSGDFSRFHRLIDLLKSPFELQPGCDDFSLPPRPEERVRATFCGT